AHAAMTDTFLARITIPDHVTFADLHLTRDPQTGGIEFDWAPIEAICVASGLNITLLRESEDNRAGLVVAWYAEHLARGGARDPVQDDLIEEALIEEAHGETVSHPPGRA
ncbi:MAG: hypothetical protein ABR578_10105, partial [Chromatocurvus sp.]